MGGTDKPEAIIHDLINELMALGISVHRNRATGVYILVGPNGKDTKVFGWVALGNFVEGIKFYTTMSSNTQEMHKWKD